ncbi:MAG TPA: type II secretion system protein GspM [Candidatus Binatia bacterium]
MMNRLRIIWKRLSKREKGLVLVGFAILALLVGRSLVYDPFVARMHRISQQLELEPQRLERNQRYVHRKPEIMANLERARGELKVLEPLLLTGDTPSVSASDLQRTVQDFASRGGTQIVSTRVLSPEAMGPFTRIPIQLEISGLIDQVANLVQGIESATKLLVINEINIRSFAVVGVPPRRPDGTSALPPQNLRVSLTVSGYIRSQPAAPSKESAAAAKSLESKKAAEPDDLRPRRPRDQ